MSNEELRKQIHSNLNLIETDELLSIWQANNRAFWSDETFEVSQNILEERGVKIPEQGEPIYESSREEILENDGLEEWEAKALDDENQPEFYDTLEVITLKDNINKTAKAIIVVYILVNILSFQGYTSLVASYFFK
jgi:hypothetical protein